MPVVTAYDDEVAEAEGVAALLARSVGLGDRGGRIRRFWPGPTTSWQWCDRP